MRLKSVYVSKYKNLNEFTLNFDGNSFIDVFVGKNGSGKSNLFEALIEIFRHLYEYDKDKAELDFNYTIIFEIDSQETKIDWRSGKLKINGKNRNTLGTTPLPDNVLIYYSGHNDAVAGLIEKYEKSFSRSIQKADFNESRRFMGIGSKYKELLLSVILMHQSNNKARQFICQKLGIQTVGTEVKLKFQRPSYATSTDFDIENNNESDRYWKPKGITKLFLDRLSKCVSSGKSERAEGYFSNEDIYILYFNLVKIQQEFSDFNSQDLFRQFDNLKTLNMLAEISISLTLENGINASISHFSDGQFQSVYIYSVVELFKDRNCITLLDEPDSFLHPEWQFDFLQQVYEINDTTAQKNNVLISSHSAATLFSLEEQTITLLKIEDFKVKPSKESKKEVIRSLSNSLIQYSEDESKLLIENVIRSSTKPILFVEGPSDVSILNTAFAKLFPSEDISVLIQDAFERGFLKNILSRNEIYKNYPQKQFFGLFDFDDGYEDWRKMKGTVLVDKIQNGLCKKLNDKNAHVFLLPVNENLKDQVWDESHTLEKIRQKPLYCIEHIFYGQPGFEKYYKEEVNNGHKKIYFKGNKVKFAKGVVPKLDAACFESFRPMFELIKSICCP